MDDWPRETERCEHGFITRMGDDVDCTCHEGEFGSDNCVYREPACDQGCPDWHANL